ncbi:hypothetical protein [Streptomyces sp. NPDC007883]
MTAVAAVPVAVPAGLVVRSRTAEREAEERSLERAGSDGRLVKDLTAQR